MGVKKTFHEKRHTQKGIFYLNKCENFFKKFPSRKLVMNWCKQLALSFTYFRAPNTPPSILYLLLSILLERSVIKARTRDQITDSLAVFKTVFMSRGRSYVTYYFGMGWNKKKCRQTRPYLGAFENFQPSQDIATGIANF